jgi:xylan 1,4-beta-xylosidase
MSVAMLGEGGFIGRKRVILFPRDSHMRRTRAFLSQFLFFAACLFISFRPSSVYAQNTAPAEVIEVDTQAPTHPFPHYWEQMFGSGRAILTLRESYQNDLREVKAATDFRYVRFHAIFHDEVGLYDEDVGGNPIYDFSYVDQIYDGLLRDHVRPFVELSFMPQKLAAANDLQAFWYKPNVSPPKDYDRWGAFITAFAKHLVDRYSIDEVSQWYFEVWNEPNIDFWAGSPKQATYFQLYDVTARAIKIVSPRLRIGGPATAQAAWVDQFIQHCAQNRVPVDFVSSHVYGNDKAQDVFGTSEAIPMTQMVCRAVDKVHNQIKASAMPELPLIWSEFNAVYDNQAKVTDTAFMGPWLGDTIRQCDGLTEMMSYWTLSDVFEEQGVIKKPFYGGFGLMAEGGIPKPVFNAFKLLHELGDRRIAINSDSAIATRRADGSVALAVWNLSLPDEPGRSRDITIDLKGMTGQHQVVINDVDTEHGSPLPEYQAMGEPASPTAAQYAELKKAAQLPPARTMTSDNGTIKLTLPPKSLFLIEVR